MELNYLEDQEHEYSGKTEIRLDLTGTSLKFDKDKLSPVLLAAYRSPKKIRGIIDAESGQAIRAAVAIDRDELMKKYAFVTEYAPRVWLNEDPDKLWLPSSVEFHLANTHPVNADGNPRAVTNEKLDHDLSALDFFHG